MPSTSESAHYGKNILNSSNDTLKIEAIQHLIIYLKIIIPKENTISNGSNLRSILSERGACGVGFIANLDTSLHMESSNCSCRRQCAPVSRMGSMHACCGADNDSGPGDGSGLMSSIAWDFFNCTVFS
ncbi:hypothetical protein YC2023_026385 [Brassica napus]